MINADWISVDEVEYLVAEFNAQVICTCGHSYIYIPYQF